MRKRSSTWRTPTGSWEATTRRWSAIRRFLELDPKNAQVHYEIAQILIDRGELGGRGHGAAGGARGRAEDGGGAQRARGRRAEPGRPAVRRNARSARRSTMKPDVRLAHFNLALLAEKRNDPATAEAEYAKELELHPNNFKAAFNLGKLYEAERRPADQEAAYRKAIEGNPRLRRRLLLPGEAAARPGARVRRSGNAGEKGTRCRAEISVRSIRTLRPRRFVQPAGTPGRRGRGGTKGRRRWRRSQFKVQRFKVQGSRFTVHEFTVQRSRPVASPRPLRNRSPEDAATRRAVKHGPKKLRRPGLKHLQARGAPETAVRRGRAPTKAAEAPKAPTAPSTSHR